MSPDGQLHTSLLLPERTSIGKLPFFPKDWWEILFHFVANPLNIGVTLGTI